MRESDVRTRLGKPPKGLTGVYDEVIKSIKSQPGCNFNLAIPALKWMLVSRRPLKPGELVVAAELDPSIAVDYTAPSQELMLAVEQLIQCCEGLLILDKTLDVVRFSHLSVQEYLEWRNEIWDIGLVDAQRFVSESCLWTLQSSLESPIYEYAALNWFHHCRSYQDLVLSAVRPRVPSMSSASQSWTASWVHSNRHPTVMSSGWIGYIIMRGNITLVPQFLVGYAQSLWYQKNE